MKNDRKFLFQTGYLSLREGTKDTLTEVIESLSKLVSHFILEDNGDDFY